MSDIRDRIVSSGGAYAPPPGLLEDLTGVRGVHVREEGTCASDLAVAASRKALDRAGIGIDDVDLLLFAATTQDMLEPSTSHIVAAKIGADCPAFDVKNACNSVLNALEVACSFIATRRYRTVLIACGEVGSLVTRWRVPDQEALMRAMPGYTVSDAGAAMVLTTGPAGDSDPGVLTLRFAADSTSWDACTVAGGGAMNPHSLDDELCTLRLNGDLLRTTAVDSLPFILKAAGGELERVRTSAFIAFHQIAMPQYHEMLDKLMLPADRCMPAVAEHGNCAAASLPLQLVKAQAADRIEPGDTVAMLGVASGMSFGLALIRW
ncbi:3-oxoacyl-[acyl-carrier-protein] synthase III C-terminal domain-containing protein [Streptomyces sp. ACA25]|uniref:3-oxoacyl-ACP synthase III family protein n=1 Tax=Streptomyces sp. ACA25 TaxID=3022596 RepID=UPI0023073089|nr:3-oxoacyl-[acyl-carrier-protein] synthase III C-terminal domain-containing protein [Streptomyces sp. ACA25]MDB1090269.1 3-oxoacyl-[acyl-carrier-protein] synthase III C-terminal domain-containing protein [Streptomyces sp. ACA25]